MQITPVVKNLIIINVALFVGGLFFPGLDLSHNFALYYIADENFMPVQFVTYMFLHADFFHVLFNMLVLFFIGGFIERFFGQKRFLIFYLVAGIGAALIYTGFNFYQNYNQQSKVDTYLESPAPGKFVSVLKDFKHQRGFRKDYYYRIAQSYSENPENTQLKQKSREIVQHLWNNYGYARMVGASGAIYGILVAFAMLFPNTQLMLFPIPVPVKAKYFVPFLLVISFVMGMQDNPNDNIAHFAHIGGAISGFILLKIWQSNRGNFY